MKTIAIFFIAFALIFGMSCERKDSGQRSTMALDTVANAEEMVFYEANDSITLEEPIFYDSTKSMLMDKDPSAKEQNLPEKLPLPEEQRK